MIASSCLNPVLGEHEEDAEVVDLSHLEASGRCINLAEGLRGLQKVRRLTLRLSDESFDIALGALAELPLLTDLGILGPPEGANLAPLAACVGLNSLTITSLYKVDVAPLGALFSLVNLLLDGDAPNVNGRIVAVLFDAGATSTQSKIAPSVRPQVAG